MQIFCFGDSVTYGGSSSWVGKLREHLKKEQDETYEIYNLGVKGDSSRELVERFENELEVREKSGEEKIIILQIGMNDSQIIKEKNDNRVQIEEFNQNLEKLWLKAKKYSENIFFLGLTPVIDSKADPVSWSNNKAYRTDQIRFYEDKLYEFCAEKDLKFIELYDQFLENGYGELLTDGEVPNDKGHLIIFEKIIHGLNF